VNTSATTAGFTVSILWTHPGDLSSDIRATRRKSKMPNLVYLVEDSSDDEFLIRRAMQRLYPHVDIRVADNGEQAVDELLMPEMPEPSLILIDIKLPRVNGLEVLAAVQKDDRYQNVPKVMLTTSSERSDIDRAYAMGANGYVQKPMEFDVFIDRFSLLLHYWLSVNIR
jgi:two-component system response regulator